MHVYIHIRHITCSIQIQGVHHMLHFKCPIVASLIFTATPPRDLGHGVQARSTPSAVDLALAGALRKKGSIGIPTQRSKVALSLSLCIYMSSHIYIYVYIHAYIDNLYTHICTHTCMWTHIYIYISLSLSPILSTYARMYTYIYIHINKCWVRGFYLI